MIRIFKLHWVAFNNGHLKLPIYKKRYQLTILLEFILTALDPPSQDSTLPTTSKYFKKCLNYNVLLGTKYAVLQFESSLFIFCLHIADNVGVYTGGRGGWCHVI